MVRSRTRARGRVRPSNGESGQLLIMTALMLPVLLSVAGLVLDVGYAFEVRRQVQTAADSAALAGAYELARDASVGTAQTRVQTVARADAIRNGFSNGVNGATVTAQWKPGTANGFEYSYTTDATAVGVAIAQTKSTFFLSLLGPSFASLTMGARAVATAAPSEACMVVLEPTGSAAYSSSGAARVSLPHCGVVVNSNAAAYALTATNSASLSAATISIGGVAPGYDASGGGSVTVTRAPFTVELGVPPLADPLAGLVDPAIPACTFATKQIYGYGTRTISPGRYCGGILANGGGTVNMNPGTYIITGGQFSVTNGATVNGTGVTIYNAAGATSVNFAGGTLTNLSAPTTGPLAGILIFQQRANTATFTVSNGAGIKLAGAIYLKAATISFTGGTFSSLYTMLIANRVVFSNGATVTLNADTSSLPGGSPLKRVTLGE